jgi:hypothetical protein
LLGASVGGLTVLLVLTASLAWAAAPTVVFDSTIAPPTPIGFDISFVKNDIAKYILADRGTSGSDGRVDLFDAAALTTTPRGTVFLGGIGTGGFVGTSSGMCGTTPATVRGCNGPNGALIDSSNHVWAGDGPASKCTTADCRCFAGETTSMVKEYTLAPSSGATGRLACVDTGGNFRADEMAFDPRDNLLLVANDFDGFLSLINTTGTPTIPVDKFFYADNDVGQPASARGLSTPGGGIEQPVWNPQQGFFYQALPQNDAGTTVGRVDVFNPKPGKLVYLRSIAVPGCTGGPTGLAISAGRELLGACQNGAALIDPNSGKVSIIGPAATTGGADEVWFDPGSNAWYLGISSPPHVGVVSAADHTVGSATNPGCCGHSVAAFTASASQSFIFDPNTATGMPPNQVGSGISVFSATP